MVRIRLRRQGAKRQPTYRIVVADQRAPRDGRILENIGFFNPRTEPETVNIDVERARYWLGVGAKPSEAVERLLKAGAYDTIFAGCCLIISFQAGVIMAPDVTAQGCRSDTGCTGKAEDECEGFDSIHCVDWSTPESVSVRGNSNNVTILELRVQGHGACHWQEGRWPTQCGRSCGWQPRS
jgi:small subunit ribosomal protein S16